MDEDEDKTKSQTDIKTAEGFEEEYGEEPDGLVAKHLQINSEEGKYLVKVPVDDVKINSLEGVSASRVSVLAKLFESLFKKVPKELDSDDIDMYLELDAEEFQDEWQVAVGKAQGAFYLLQEEEAENERTKYVPEVIDKTEGKDG